MIGFVLHSPSEQLFSVGLEPVSFGILRANRALHGTCDVLAEVRKAKTSFAMRLPPFLLHDLWIDNHHFRAHIFFERAIDYRDFLRDSDLWRGESYSMGGVHGFEHVFDKPL